MLLFISSCVIGTSRLYCQNIPLEWEKYTSSEYVSDVQHDINLRDKSETDFKNYLVDIARANIAKQIQIRVTDYASLDKVSIDGKSSTSYTSSTQFSTNLNVKLVEVKSYYSSFTKEGYAIAYINKGSAVSTYIKDVQIIFSKIRNSLAIAETYVANGFKTKARTKLESTKNEIIKLNEPFFWLAIFDCSEYKLNQLLKERTILENTLADKLSELQHGINIYIQCSADMFGVPYKQLAGDVKKSISSIGCSFCNNAQSADWVITIRSAAEEYNQINIGGNSAYFSYIHANVSIKKTVTGQNIYEGEITEKGSHTHNYNQAARDGYKKITKQISEILLNHIK